MKKPFFSAGSLAAALVLFAVPAVPLPQAQNPSAAPQAQNPPAAPNAQKPSENPNYKLTVRSNLVLVPVIVTDKRGEHIPGLKAEDFEVKEDDKVQSLVRVDEVNVQDATSVARPPEAANTFSNEVTEHPKKLEIIALDQINVPFAGGADGNRALIEFLSRNLDANTLLSLVALTPNGVRIIHDFTAQPSTLVAAFSKIRNKLNTQDVTSMDVRGENSAADIEVLQLNALLSGAGVDITSGGSGPEAVRLARAATANAHATVDASRRAQEGLITLECFQQIAEYFGGVQGRKSLIWASTAFPFALGSGTDNSTTHGTLMSDWDRTFQALTDANIAVYPVDIGGLATGATANNLQTLNTTIIRTGGAEGGVAGRSQGLAALDAGKFTDPNVGRQETMRQLADKTGGQAFYNSNDGAELFRRAGEDAGQYYTVAYYTKDTGKYGWRKLSVKVKRDGIKVRNRSGFFFNDPRKQNDPNASLKDLRMAMTSDLSFTSVPLRGEWLQTEQAGDQRKVHFVLSIPAGVPAIDAEHENHISLEFLVVATDKTGKNVTINQRLDTKLKPEGVDQIQNKGLDYANVLNLPPGEYKVHFVVRDNLRGIMGSVVSPLKID